MRPLRKGKARTELAQGLAKIFDGEEVTTSVQAHYVARRQAAILGGAIAETCKDMAIDPEIFFRYTNENLWRLTRALEASNLLDKAGE